MSTLQQALDLITAQQAGQKNNVFWCGEQLKDICRLTPGAAELVAHDLEQPGMGIAGCEAKIRERANKDKKMTAAVADEVIRAFYGIGPQPEGAAAPAVLDPPAPAQGGHIDLLSLMD